MSGCETRSKLWIPAPVLSRVTVEVNVFQSGEDGVHGGATSDNEEMNRKRRSNSSRDVGEERVTARLLRGFVPPSPRDGKH